MAQSITGKYFVDCKVTQPASQSADMAVARKLWDISAEMVHLADASQKWHSDAKWQLFKQANIKGVSNEQSNSNSGGE